MLQELALLFPCLVCLFWTITFAIRWKKNLRAQNVWAVASLLAAINAFYWTILVMPDLRIYHYVGRIVTFTQTGFFCLLFLFYRALIDDRPFSRRHYIVFIPALLIGIANTLLLLLIEYKDQLAAIAAFLGSKNKLPKEGGVALLPTLHYLIGGPIASIVDILMINFTLIPIIARWINCRKDPESFFELSDRQSRRYSRAALCGLTLLLFVMLAYMLGEFLYYIEDYIPFPILFLAQGVLFFYIGFQVYFLEKEEGRSAKLEAES